MPGPDPVAAAGAGTLGQFADLLRVPRSRLASICAVSAADALARGQPGMAAGLVEIAATLAKKDCRPMSNYPDDFKGTLPGENWHAGAAKQEELDGRRRAAAAEVEGVSDWLGQIWNVEVQDSDAADVTRAEAVAKALRGALAPFRGEG